MDLPTYCRVKGRRGRCRVLEYLGNDRFRVLLPDDSTLRVHRNLITFLKESK